MPHMPLNCFQKWLMTKVSIKDWSNSLFFSSKLFWIYHSYRGLQSHQGMINYPNFIHLALSPFKGLDF